MKPLGNSLLHKPYLLIAIIVVVVFLFSSNRSWVYHRPDNNGGYFVSAYPKNIPFMWQYDADSMEFFQAAAFFPEFYRSHPALIGRPLLPFLSHFIGKAIVLSVEPILGEQLEQYLFKGSGAQQQVEQTLEKRGVNKANSRKSLLSYLSALVGMITVKIVFFIISGWAMYRLISRYVDSSFALLGVTLLFFSPYAIRSITTYHTYEFQILSPIIILYLFQKLSDSYSLRTNLVYSLIVGTLMMGKANYAPYIAVLFFAIIFVKPRSTAIIGVTISVLAHLIPWIIWTGFIETHQMSIIGLLSAPDHQTLAIHPADIIGRKILGLDLISETKMSGSHAQPGVDFVNIIFNFNIQELFRSVGNHVVRSITTFATLPGALAVVGLFLSRTFIQRQIVFIICIFVFSTWLQAFISFPLGPKSRSLYDISFLVFGFASFSILYLIDCYFKAYRRFIVTVVVTLYIAYNFSTFVRLPWVHPFDQVPGTPSVPILDLRHTNIEISTTEYQGA